MLNYKVNIFKKDETIYMGEWQMHKNKTEETAADHLEFNEMFRRNEAIVYNFIRYRILDKSLAQDVMQETFYLAYKKWDILKDHPNQTGWL